MLRVLHSFPTRRSSDLIGAIYSLKNMKQDMNGHHFFRQKTFFKASLIRNKWLYLIWSSFFIVQNPDRKSTRLNSSHVATSYAVFCLKKKTNKMQKRAAR